jgi:hypothetical protein
MGDRRAWGDERPIVEGMPMRLATLLALLAGRLEERHRAFEGNVLPFKVRQHRRD